MIYNILQARISYAFVSRKMLLDERIKFIIFYFNKGNFRLANFFKLDREMYNFLFHSMQSPWQVIKFLSTSQSQNVIRPTWTKFITVKNQPRGFVWIYLLVNNIWTCFFLNISNIILVLLWYLRVPTVSMYLLLPQHIKVAMIS